jgi:hypothetical protein
MIGLPAMKTLLLRSALLLLLLGAATGCTKHYWYKAGITPEVFAGDSQGCVQQAATNMPPGASADAIEQFYRACLASRGYLRDMVNGPPPPGFYRGIEDDDALRAAVQQAATQAPRQSFEQQLAQLDDLKARGRISDEEYAIMRKRLVDGTTPSSLGSPPPPPPPPVAAASSVEGRWFGRNGGILDIKSAGGLRVQWSWENNAGRSTMLASGTGTVTGNQVNLSGNVVSGSGPVARYSFTLTQEGSVLRGVAQGPNNVPVNIELRRDPP